MIKSHKQLAYQHLRRKLQTGSLRPGARLSEVELAKEVGISRTPLREAIGLLESEGLVRQIPRFGAFVCKPTAKECRDLWDLREALEAHAAIRAMDLLTPAHFNELSRCCEIHMAELRAFKRSGYEDVESLNARIRDLDLAFHTTIVKAADNTWLLKIIADHHVISGLMSISWSRQDKMESYESHIRVWVDHVRLIRAIKRKDVERIRRILAGHIGFNARYCIDEIPSELDLLNL